MKKLLSVSVLNALLLIVIVVATFNPTTVKGNTLETAVNTEVAALTATPDAPLTPTAVVSETPAQGVTGVAQSATPTASATAPVTSTATATVNAATVVAPTTPAVSPTATVASPTTSVLSTATLTPTASAGITSAALAASTALPTEQPTQAPTVTYTESQDGNFSSQCSAYWYAEAIMDPSLGDYSNNGYTFKLKCGLFPSDPGRFEVEHWVSGNTLYWRLPIGTAYQLLNAKVALSPSSNWVINAGTFAVDTKNFALFTEETQYLNPSGATPTMSADGLTITIGNMPADSNTMVVFTGTPVDGSIDPGDTFTLGATLTADYVQGGAPDCSITVPPAPVISSSPCRINLAGQTVFPINANDIVARDKWDDYGAIHLTNGYGDPTDDYWRSAPEQLGEINGDGWGAYPNRGLRLYAGVNVDTVNAEVAFTAEQGFIFTGVSKVFTGAPGGMGALYGAGYVNPVTLLPGVNPTITDGGKKITFTIASMPAMSGFAIGASTAPDNSGKAYVINSTLKGDLAHCPGAISGTVFEDLNQDVAFDTSDTVIPNYLVNLYDSTDTLIATTTTDVNGYYEFTNLQPGDYIVKIEIVDPYTGNTTPLTQNVTVVEGITTENVNFGLIQPPAPTVLATTDVPTTVTPVPTTVTPAPTIETPVPTTTTPVPTTETPVPTATTPVPTATATATGQPTSVLGTTPTAQATQPQNNAANTATQVTTTKVASGVLIPVTGDNSSNLFLFLLASVASLILGIKLFRYSNSQ